ncbi:MAG: ABC transporter substrate-binding protein [Sneathiellaceae bacterium]
MKRLAPILALLLFAMPAQAETQRPQRIVSMNLCADQYLMALADKGQVAALTHYARDPALSAEAVEAESWPVTRGSAEEILLLQPDLVIASPFRRKETRALLEPFGFPTLEIRPARSFAEIVAQTRQIAAAIGQAARGERLVAAMQAEMAGVDSIGVAPAPEGERPEAVHYQRRGFVTGTETLLDEIMAQAGLDNLAARLGKRFIGRVGLEEIVAAAPDHLLLSQGNDRAVEQAVDLGTELLLHPVLLDRHPRDRRLTLPQAATVCGGPSYAPAVRRLREQVRGAHPAGS